MALTTFQFIMNRCNELKGQTRFPTAYDALASWIGHINEVVKNIEETSLNYEDKRLRLHQLMDDLLKAE